PANDQPNMAQLFRLNEKWPYPLKPSEYVQRQFHVQFQDDPVAVACRHITGVTSIVWGNDYPHAEGTFRGSRELLAKQCAGAPAGVASDVAAEIVTGGGGAIADTSDVATADGAQALVDTAVERFGRLDILVNNAGIIRWAGFPEADEDNLARHLAVHVAGSFN